MDFLINYVILTLVLLLGISIKNFYKFHKLKFPRIKFSIKNYYLLLAPAPISAIISSFSLGSLKPFLLFITFCVAGIIGEVLFSVWWHHFYVKRFWVYTTKTFFNKYTSSLNFLAWGVGGFIFIKVLSYFQNIQNTNIPFIFTAFLSIGILLQLIFFHLIIKRFLRVDKFDKFNFLNWSFFSLPILVTLIILFISHGISFLILFFLFGIISALYEYIFGKAIQAILSRKFWKYNYLALDKGHFTILSLLLFSAGGIYFWFVFELFNLLY